MTTKQKRTKRRPNPGHFRVGFDARRHILTKEERSRGYWHAMYFSKSMRVTVYVERKVRGYYRQRKRAARGA